MEHAEITEHAQSIANAAYQLTTDGTIQRAYPWQATLYAQLSNVKNDAGILLTAPTGAGKLEGVIIPSLGLRRGGAPRRVFVIEHDGSSLDDSVYRLTPYLRASAAADGVVRTLYTDRPDADPAESPCWSYLPDGTEDRTACWNPLEANVDLVLTTFSRFRELFFGGGGVHALPSALGVEEGETERRDLFFFNDAHGYSIDEFSQFHKLVEFLFAEDMDVIVASSNLPEGFREELSFLEPVQVNENAFETRRTVQCIDAPDPVAVMSAEVRARYFQNSRAGVVVNSVQDATTVFASLSEAYPHSVFLYHEAMPVKQRQTVYAQLRELEKEGEGYLLCCTGTVLETSDLDLSLLVTTLCPPENLILRMGRCNRRGDLPCGELIIVGKTIDHNSTYRTMNRDQLAGYTTAIESNTSADDSYFRQFI